MRWLQAVCLGAYIFLSGSEIDQNWMEAARNNKDDTVTEWLRGRLNHVREKSGMKQIEAKPSKCSVYGSVESVEYPLRVFISFSLPQEAWVALSKEVERVGGVFVLRGISENSFEEFSQRLSSLRKRGMTINVEIDPRQFSEFHITSVPAFVVAESGCIDTVVGHVSVGYALEQMAKHGGTRRAKQLFEELRGRKNG